MNAARVMRTLLAYLTEEGQGEVAVSSAVELEAGLEQITGMAPSRVGVVLVWTGHSGPVEADLPLVQDLNFSALVRVPVGLAPPGRALVERVGGGSISTLEWVEWVRLALCRLDLESAKNDIDRARGWVMDGSEWYAKEPGKPTQVHEIKLSLRVVLDQTVSRAVVSVVEEDSPLIEPPAP